MSIPSQILRSNKYFYHFTHIDNIESIFNEGLFSNNLKKQKGITHTNISYSGIQERRSMMPVTCGDGGVIHDYVPFYFCSMNPMLLGLVRKKKIDQHLIVFLAIPIEKIHSETLVFTDSSANTTESPNFYNNPSDLLRLDWTNINSRKWGNENDMARHNRMSEVLIYKKVPLEWFSHIIVFYEPINKRINAIFDSINLKNRPILTYQPHDYKYFYFTKFTMKGRENETLIHGPIALREIFDEIQECIIKKRQVRSNFSFKNLHYFIQGIESNFSCIDELKGIWNLETENDVHLNSVSEHTIQVVNNIKTSTKFKEFDEYSQNILLLSGYLHDIGKGPHSKWKNGKQPIYPDHPADSLKMLERILSEEIEELFEKDIRLICLLVGYHDIIGDIIAENRSEEELINLVNNLDELNLLVFIAKCDTLAIRTDWYYDVCFLSISLIERIKAIKGW